MLESAVHFFLDLFHIVLFLLIASVFFGYKSREKLCKIFLVFTFVWFAIASTPFFPGLLINALENRYIPLSAESELFNDKELHIVVLGAGYSYHKSFPPNTQLNRVKLGRLVEGIRIYKELPGIKLITSGSYKHRKMSQADVSKQTAMLLGVPEDDIYTMDEPTNRFEEAKSYAEKFYRGNSDIILVTSSTHMKRAVMVFKYFVIDARPSPTNYKFN